MYKNTENGSENASALCILVFYTLLYELHVHAFVRYCEYLSLGTCILIWETVSSHSNFFSFNCKIKVLVMTMCVRTTTLFEFTRICDVLFLNRFFLYGCVYKKKYVSRNSRVQRRNWLRWWELLHASECIWDMVLAFYCPPPPEKKEKKSPNTNWHINTNHRLLSGVKSFIQWDLSLRPPEK